MGSGNWHKLSCLATWRFFNLPPSYVPRAPDYYVGRFFVNNHKEAERG
jgi:hypothetical protein